MFWMNPTKIWTEKEETSCLGGSPRRKVQGRTYLENTARSGGGKPVVEEMLGGTKGLGGEKTFLKELQRVLEGPLRKNKRIRNAGNKGEEGPFGVSKRLQKGAGKLKKENVDSPQEKKKNSGDDFGLREEGRGKKGAITKTKPLVATITQERKGKLQETERPGRDESGMGPKRSGRDQMEGSLSCRRFKGKAENRGVRMPGNPGCRNRRATRN